MAITLSPIPALPISDVHEWRDWFFKVGNTITGLDHNSLSGLQGGGGDGYYHLTADQASALARGVDGTFLSGDATPKTITVTNGIITSIV